MKATGTNTAASTSVIVTIGVVISAIAARVASSGRRPRWRYFSTFSTTMIASSTTRPIARTSPQSVSELIEKPKAAITANVATSETGIASIGMIVARKPWRKTNTTIMTRTNDSISVCSTSLDVLLDVLGRVVDDRVVEPLREARLEAGPSRCADLLDDRQRVGVGVLVDQDAAGGLAVDVAGRLEVLRRELDAGDVLERGRSSRRRCGGR